VGVVRDHGRVPEPVEQPEDDLKAVVAELHAVIADLRGVVESQAAVIEELQREKGRNSSNSGKPPSSDPVFDKQARSCDRSSRERGKRRPGKQHGDGSGTMNLVDDPDETVPCAPGECAGCGAGLAGAPVSGVQRRQVTEAQAPPPPKVTEYLVQAKRCGWCGVTSVGAPPAHVTGRAQFGPIPTRWRRTCWSATTSR
jgi:transposase